MALERLGLGAIVKFDGTQATRGMATLGGSVSTLAGKVRAAGATMGSSMTAFGGGLVRAGAALTPFTAALGLGMKQAADFEQGMADVQAVANATEDEFSSLTLEAKRLGATTKFTATESAGAMEGLSRAGFNAKETLVGLRGVVNLAAADSKTLEQATMVVASTIRGMGLEAKEASRVADVLAKTSQRTNTDIVDLGEGLKFATPVARELGISLPVVTTALGAMADAGVRGTLGGTALKNALIMLSKPSDAAVKHFQKLGVGIRKFSDGSVDLFGTFRDISASMDKMSDKTEKMAMLQDMFGKRGMPAFTSVAAAMKQAEGEGFKLDNLLKELNQEMTVGGAAAKAAKIRIDTFKGAITILKSTIEGFNIEFATGFLKGGKGNITTFLEGFSDVVVAMQLLNQGVSTNDERFKELGGTAIAIAKGIKAGIDTVSSALSTAKNAVMGFLSRFGKADTDIITMIAKIATIGAIVAAALAPVMIALGGIVAFFGAVLVPILTAGVGAALATVGAAFLVAAKIGIVAFSAVLLIFLIVRKEGESVGETFMRIWNGIGAVINYVIDTAIMPFWKAFTSKVNVLQWVGQKVMALFNKVRSYVLETVQVITDAFVGLKPLFQLLFRELGNIVGFFVNGVAGMFGGLVTIIGAVIDKVKALTHGIVSGVMFALVKTMELIVAAAKALGQQELLPPEFMEFMKSGKAFLMLEEAGYRGMKPSGREHNALKDSVGMAENEIDKYRRLSALAKTAARQEDRADLEKKLSIQKDIVRGMIGDVQQMDSDKAAILQKEFDKAGGMSKLGRILAASAASNQAKKAAAPAAAQAEQPCIDNRVEVSTVSELNLDGKKVAKAMSKNQIDIDERRGFKATPWQKRFILEQGATTVATG